MGKIQASRVTNSIILSIRNMKFSKCRFSNERKHIYGDIKMPDCTFKGDKEKMVRCATTTNLLDSKIDKNLFSHVIILYLTKKRNFLSL